MGGQPMRLAGKVALITGAAAGVEGQLMGFGGAAARLFAREGARVVLTDIKKVCINYFPIVSAELYNSN